MKIINKLETYLKEEINFLESIEDKITHYLSYQDLIDEYIKILDKIQELKDSDD